RTPRHDRGSAAVCRRDRWTHRWMRRLARHVPSTRLYRPGLATRRGWDPLGSSCRVRLPGPDIRGGDPCRLGYLRSTVLRKLGYELATKERSGSEPFWMKKTFVVAR